MILSLYLLVPASLNWEAWKAFNGSYIRGPLCVSSQQQGMSFEIAAQVMDPLGGGETGCSVEGQRSEGTGCSRASGSPRKVQVWIQGIDVRPMSDIWRDADWIAMDIKRVEEKLSNMKLTTRICYLKTRQEEGEASMGYAATEVRHSITFILWLRGAVKGKPFE